jgi:hypothetical protein
MSGHAEDSISVFVHMSQFIRRRKRRLENKQTTSRGGTKIYAHNCGVVRETHKSTKIKKIVLFRSAMATPTFAMTQA